MPCRACPWEQAGGKVALLRPRFGRGRLGSWLQRTFHLRPIKVLLDDVGSFAWMRCDGSARVAEIARAMEGEFGTRVEPVEERLVSFLQSLLREKLIQVDHPDGIQAGETKSQSPGSGEEARPGS